jgi:hypothetical protein
VPTLPLKISGLFLASLALAGCGGSGFDLNGLLESRPVRLDGEQVAMNLSQVECGVQDDLWTVTPMGDERSLGRLTQKGRDLQFGDDIQIVSPRPYAQVRGSFSLKVLQVGNIQETDAFTKTAEAKVGVRIDHKCFQDNLPVLMGIRHGEFTASASTLFRFKLENEWQFDQIIH